MMHISILDPQTLNISHEGSPVEKLRIFCGFEFKVYRVRRWLEDCPAIARAITEEAKDFGSSDSNCNAGIRNKVVCYQGLANEQSSCARSGNNAYRSIQDKLNIGKGKLTSILRLEPKTCATFADLQRQAKESGMGPTPRASTNLDGQRSTEGFPQFLCAWIRWRSGREMPCRGHR